MNCAHLHLKDHICLNRFILDKEKKTNEQIINEVQCSWFISRDNYWGGSYDNKDIHQKLSEKVSESQKLKRTEMISIVAVVIATLSIVAQLAILIHQYYL
jgi:hypothetical protein